MGSGHALAGAARTTATNAPSTATRACTSRRYPAPDGRPPRRHRPGLQLLPPRGLHGRRRLVERPTRSTRPSASARAWPRPASWASPGWRARRRRWRSSPTSARPAAFAPGRRSPAVATSAIRDATNSAAFLAPRQEATGLEVRVLRGRGGGALRLPRGRELVDARPTASCSTSAAARCSSSTGRPARLRARLVAAGRGAHERALPARRRPGQEQAAQGAARSHIAGKLERAPWLSKLRAAAGRHRRDRAQPGRRRPARPRDPRVRGPGLRADARGARPHSSRSWPPPHPGRARQGSRHQALARRLHSRGRRRRGERDGGRAASRASR